MNKVPKAFIEGVKQAILPELRDLKERMIRVESEIVGLRGEIQGLKSEFQGLRDRFDALNDRVSALNSKDELIRVLLEELKKEKGIK
jgi:chromosome segregation ATPase